jgi:hypothetical protein
LSKAYAAPRWIPLAILGLALAVRLLTAWPLRQPGYTDAYYYAVGAQQLAAGQGFQEPFIWNYLDPPDKVPHPGYAYWMPLTAILGGLGLALLGKSFAALQLPFILLSTALPLVAYGVALDLTGRPKHAVLAALLAVFPGFYAHVLVLPDNFAPFALAGSLCLWTAGRGLRDRRPLWFGLAGVAAGFAHLARADGLLLLAIAFLSALISALPIGRQSAAHPQSRLVWLRSAGLVLGGYLLIMSPWFVRNCASLGTPLPGAGARTLFLTSYDDLFAYGRPLTLESYLAWGWSEILRSKGQALGINLLRLWLEALLVVLLPFSALGFWKLRRERLIWPFLLYAPLLFIAMTILFTFPGMRGGLFHSAGALLPFLFAAAGPGLDVCLRWAATRFRGWHARRAWTVFSTALVGMTVLVTVIALWRAGVINQEWNQRYHSYAQVGDWLSDQGAAGAVVMVGNAPAFTWHTGHTAVAIPNEPLETILAVADRYDARYLVLDGTRPRTTDDLYDGETTHSHILLRTLFGDESGPVQVFERTGRSQP